MLLTLFMIFQRLLAVPDRTAHAPAALERARQLPGVAPRAGGFTAPPQRPRIVLAPIHAPPSIPRS